VRNPNREGDAVLPTSTAGLPAVAYANPGDFGAVVTTPLPAKRSPEEGEPGEAEAIMGERFFADRSISPCEYSDSAAALTGVPKPPRTLVDAVCLFTGLDMPGRAEGTEIGEMDGGAGARVSGMAPAPLLTYSVSRSLMERACARTSILVDTGDDPGLAYPADRITTVEVAARFLEARGEGELLSSPKDKAPDGESISRSSAFRLRVLFASGLIPVRVEVATVIIETAAELATVVPERRPKDMVLLVASDGNASLLDAATIVRVDAEAGAKAVAEVRVETEEMVSCCNRSDVSSSLQNNLLEQKCGCLLDCIRNLRSRGCCSRCDGPFRLQGLKFR
jgi:hypothetical protein